MACLSFLLPPMIRGDRADAAVVITDTSVRAATLPSPAHKKVITHGIDFEPNTAIIRPEASPVLNETVQLLGSDAPIVITVEPPSDDRRSHAYRLLLARRRAKAVRRYLVDHGVAARRIALPHDAAAAVATGDSAADNQPVELHVE